MAVTVESHRLHLGNWRTCWPLLPNWADSGGKDWLFGHQNNWFTAPDVWVLAGFLHENQPTRVIEVGSGWSTSAMLDCRRSGIWSGSVTTIDPDLRRLKSIVTAPGLCDAICSQVQDVPIEFFDQLLSGDILFVDSSHCVGPGSDVNFLLFDVLPRLKPGVLIHFHDVFWPWEYPALWGDDARGYTELFALRALLENSTRWEIVWWGAWLFHEAQSLFRDSMPADTDFGGCSMWIRSTRVHG